jgi:hypothetical protein
VKRAFALSSSVSSRRKITEGSAGTRGVQIDTSVPAIRVGEVGVGKVTLSHQVLLCVRWSLVQTSYDIEITLRIINITEMHRITHPILFELSDHE